jgi:hypothetical protein
MHDRIKEDGVNSCSITSDGWSGPQQRKYVCITLHYVDEQLNMVNMCFDFVEFSEKQTAVNLRTFFEARLSSLCDNILIHAMVVDNGANFKKAAIDMQGNESVLPCTAHTLQFVVREVLSKEPWTGLLDYVRGIVHDVKYKSSLREAYSAACTAENMPALALIDACETRWSSEYDMLASFLKQKNALVRLAVAVLPEKAANLMSDDFWAVVHAYVQALRGFKAAVDWSQGECAGMIAELHPRIEELKHGLLQATGNPTVDVMAVDLHAALVG